MPHGFESSGKRIDDSSPVEWAYVKGTNEDERLSGLTLLFLTYIHCIAPASGGGGAFTGCGLRTGISGHYDL